MAASPPFQPAPAGSRNGEDWSLLVCFLVGEAWVWQAGMRNVREREREWESKRDRWPPFQRSLPRNQRDIGGGKLWELSLPEGPGASRRDRWLTEEPHLRDPWCPLVCISPSQLTAGGPVPPPSLGSRPANRISALPSQQAAECHLCHDKIWKYKQRVFVSLGYGWWGFIQTECSASLNFPRPFKAKTCAVNQTTFPGIPNRCQTRKAICSRHYGACFHNAW